MHVVYIPTIVPTKSFPEAGVFFVEQAELYASAGNRVSLFAPAFSTKGSVCLTLKKALSLGLWFDAYSVGDVKIYRSYVIRRLLSKSIFYKKIIHDLWLRRFRKFIEKEGKPDLIHLHCCLPYGGLASRIAEQNNLPLAITEHYSRIAQKNLSAEECQQITEVGTIADGVAAVGNELKLALEELLEPKGVVVIPNAVDTDFFMPRKVNSDPGGFIITIVARLCAIKRVDVLILAMKEVSKQLPDCHLNIVGDGDMKNELLELTDKLGLNDQISFLGRCSRSGVRDIYALTDVVVSSSETETFGVTLIEAMSCGIPVISTNSGGPNQFVTKETGILVENGDPKALADAIICMEGDFNNYSAEGIRKYAVENFGRNALVENLDYFYNGIVTDLGPSR